MADEKKCALYWKTVGELQTSPDAAKAEGYFERALAATRQQQTKSWELGAATMPASGAIKASATKPAIFSRRSTDGKETANRSSAMSENIDGAGGRSPGPRLLVRPLLLFAGVALVIGFVAVRRDVEPYQTPFFRLFFSNTLHMKAWLTTAALLLGLGQLVTAARIYEKLRFPPEGRLYPLLHRWSGRAAILLTVPAAYHCIFKLGFGTYDARAFIHSLLGASFYGAFSAKVLIVRTSGYPGWALPMAGGVLFAILMVLWLTSAFWLFGTHGVSL